MKLLIGLLIVLASIILILLSTVGIYFIILMIVNIKEAIEDLKEG